MVIFQYNLCIFGSHLWTMLYPKPCYNKLCYEEVEVLYKIRLFPAHQKTFLKKTTKNNWYLLVQFNKQANYFSPSALPVCDSAAWLVALKIWTVRLFSLHSANIHHYMMMHRLTGDQEVAGSTPAEVGNILSWRLIMKYFLRSFSPFHWFKKGSCQFLAKECAQYWLTT